MFRRKKKKNVCLGEIIAPSLLTALAIYFVMLGVRINFLCYSWLCWDALALYFVGVVFFMWGRHMAMQCKI